MSNTFCEVELILYANDNQTYYSIYDGLVLNSNNGKLKCAVVYGNVPNNFILIRKWRGVEND